MPFKKFFMLEHSKNLIGVILPDKFYSEEKPKGNLQVTRSGKRTFTFTDKDHLKLQMINAMPPYKQMVVRRAFKREKYTDAEELEDPSNHLMRYDFKQDKLFVGSVQVLIHEEKETLTCSACLLSCQMPAKGNIKMHCCVEKRLREHIIGTHLGGFKCPFCDQVRTSRTMYLEHLREAHKGARVKKQRIIDIVDKPHKCTSCEYSTNKACDLRRHLKTHERKKAKQAKKESSVKKITIVVKQEVTSDEDTSD